MLHLNILTDQCLLEETQKLVRQERELLTIILHHLREIERRRLYGQNPSLFAYAVATLGYSEDQAYRRISAMRLLKSLPQIETQLQTGELNLSHVGLAQSLFKAEKKKGNSLNTETKLEVFAAIAGQSARESQKIIRRFSGDEIEVREVIKSIGEGRNMVTLEITDAMLEKIAKLKGLLAHKSPDLSTAALVDQTFDLALEQWNPGKVSRRKIRPGTKAHIKRLIWQRDGGVCVLCGSGHAVQEDHVVPASMGGEYTVENMRLLCRSCNQRAAIEKLGLSKMDPHLSPATSPVGAV